MKRPSLSVLLVAIVFTVAARASDVALLVDVSGSMSKYGPWQGDAARVIKQILEKGSLGDEGGNWSISGDPALVKYFRLGNGDHIQLVKFGSIRPNTSTFFPAETLATAGEAEEKFPSISEFRDTKTNKELATAVGVKLVGRPKEAARVVSASDFLQDADLTLEQQAFVNSVMQGTSIENKLVLSWRKNPRVMLRFQRISVALSDDGNTNPTGEKGTLQLTPAKLDSQSRSLTLAWHASGPRPAQFDVKVASAEGDVLLSKTGLIASEVLLKDPPGGAITWTVTAHYAGGATTSASRQEVLPDTGNTSVILAACVVGGLLIAGLLLMRKHGEALVASARRLFGKSTGSDL